MLKHIIPLRDMIYIQHGSSYGRVVSEVHRESPGLSFTFFAHTRARQRLHIRYPIIKPIALSACDCRKGYGSNELWISSTNNRPLLLFRQSLTGNSRKIWQTSLQRTQPGRHCFNKLEQFRRMATCYGKTTRNDLFMLFLATPYGVFRRLRIT